MIISEYLVKHKHGAPGKVTINGGSNGGTLVAACLNRAPEGTFGAAVADVGVMDLFKVWRHLYSLSRHSYMMLMSYVVEQYTKFTIGYAWTSDYGDPAVPEDFDFIRYYSPLHNIPKDRILPPTILLTADRELPRPRMLPTGLTNTCFNR